MKRSLACLALWIALPLHAEERIDICYGYSCLTHAEIVYSDGQLGEVRRLLFSARSAEEERARLAEAVGRLYAWGGEQSSIRNDRGGNYADNYVEGRMDCIDHSTSTSRLLRMLAALDYLRWHKVLEPEPRYFAGVFAAHWSAVIEEQESSLRFVVDSWFVNNGEPAVILPLEEWKKGAGPDV